MKKSVFLLLILVVLFLGLRHAGAQGQSGYVVIANADNPATSLSKSQVSKLMLKKVTKWENGRRAEPVDQSIQQEVRAAFTKDVHGRSVSGIKNYWQREVFSGKNVPPPEVGSDSEVVNFVKVHPGGLGYVSSGARVDGVKVLSVTE